ncbi:MAG: mechanosensitive ion channel [Sphingomonadales bacterium]|nr:mechanosensitive ion channel [Sphingomonadales bacterium]MDE2171442.1 mechanosensitive ion channel [Sphingomonadales bacterium]
MDLRYWLAALGMRIPDVPDLDAILVASGLVLGALVLGWLAGRQGSRRIAFWLQRAGADGERFSDKAIEAVLRYAVMALLVLLAASAAPPSPIASFLVALALGAVTGLLIVRVMGLLRGGRMLAAIVATIGAVAASAGLLGGMAPLLASLDALGFTVGRHRLSLLSTINAVITIAVLYGLVRVANNALGHIIGRASALDLSQRVLMQKLAGIGVVLLAVMIGVDLLGIDLTALTVFSGAAGLAVGFGLQKTFGNLIAGLILLMDRSIKPGDVIVVGETFGAVGKIGIRAVSVLTRDGKEHLIPNEQLMTEPVENWSYSSRNVRIHIPVGIGYSSDLALAQRLMIEAATAAARVLPQPAPSVWLKGFGDNSVDHDILLWIADPELGVGNVRSDVLNRVWKLFAEHGIEIPFPQRDIHVRSWQIEAPRNPAEQAIPGRD